MNYSLKKQQERLKACPVVNSFNFALKNNTISKTTQEELKGQLPKLRGIGRTLWRGGTYIKAVHGELK